MDNKKQLIINIAFFAIIFLLDMLYFFVSRNIGGNISIICKTIASLSFVACGVVNFCLAKKYIKGYNNTYQITMLIGLVFAMLGDVVLELNFIIGAILFAVGHVVFFLSYCFNSKLCLKDLLFILPIILFSVCFVLFFPYLNLSGLKIVVLIYAIIISCMVGKAMANYFLNGKNLSDFGIMVGSIMFYLSDFMLVLNIFLLPELKHPIYGLLCLVLYYPAEFMLAFSLLGHEKFNVKKIDLNIYQKIYYRIYQFAFKILMPFFPYRSPKLLQDYSEMASQLKNNKVLLVTDQNLNSLGITKNAEKNLKYNKINYVVFDDVQPNPTIKNIEDGLEVYIKNGCSAIVAIGGGSVMDCAKIIGARVAKPKQSVNKMKGLLKIRKKIPTMVAIPTTAGTGSETTLAAVITDHIKNYKYPINDFVLIPKYALLDEELTLNLPKHITSTTGMDALTHAVEAYIGGSTTKQTRRLSEQAVTLIFQNLITAYNQLQNQTARKNMLVASYKAGVAFSRSYVGYVHAIAHSLGGKYHVAHGLANAVILPVMLKEYGGKVYKKLGKLAKITGVAGADANNKQATQMFIQKIEQMNMDMQIPTNIPEIKDSDIPELSKIAAKEANPLYPVPKLLSAKQLEEVYLKLK